MTLCICNSAPVYEGPQLDCHEHGVALEPLPSWADEEFRRQHEIVNYFLGQAKEAASQHPALMRILVLHRPFGNSWAPFCRVCRDLGGHRAAWPCRTVKEMAL